MGQDLGRNQGDQKAVRQIHPARQAQDRTAAAPEIDASIEEALIEKEPVTIVLSEKGWIRALKGHDADLEKLAFKTDDSLKYACKAQTTDKLVLFATNGKFYTLDASELPGGRGQGEPVKLMVDLKKPTKSLKASSTSRAANCSSPPISATASSCPKRRSSHKPAKASKF